MDILILVSISITIIILVSYFTHSGLVQTSNFMISVTFQSFYFMKDLLSRLQEKLLQFIYVIQRIHPWNCSFNYFNQQFLLMKGMNLSGIVTSSHFLAPIGLNFWTDWSRIKRLLHVQFNYFGMYHFLFRILTKPNCIIWQLGAFRVPMEWTFSLPPNFEASTQHFTTCRITFVCWWKAE